MKTFFIMAVMAFAATAALGQTPGLQLDGSRYFESYAPEGSRGSRPKNVDRSRAVVGLHLGRGRGRFVLSDLQAVLPVGGVSTKLCVKITGPDGRYWSVNGYKPPTLSSGMVPIETRSRYAAELSSSYQADDVAVEIVATADCSEDPAGALIPAVLPGTLERNSLQVELNLPGSRASAALVDARNVVVTQGRCDAPDNDTAIAFTTVCDIPLPNATKPGAVRLQVTSVDATGSLVRSGYDLRLSDR